MKRIITLMALVVCTLMDLHAQPTPVWTKNIGGSRNDLAWQVRMQGNTIIVVGASHSVDGDWEDELPREGDMFICKLDLDGNILQKKKIGGDHYDYCTAVEPTADGGYILVGGTNSSDGHATGSGYHGGFGSDIWVVKLGPALDVKWQHAFGGTQHEEATAVLQTDDDGDGRKNDGFIVVGYTFSTDGDVQSLRKGDIDTWVIKLDGAGNLQWEKSLGGDHDEYGRDVEQLPDGSLLVISETYSPDILGYHQLPSANYGQYADWWLVKLDATGNLLWDKAWGGNYSEIPYEIQLTDDDGDGQADDGFIIVGNGESRDGDAPLPEAGMASWDIFLVKFDMDANVQWKKRYGGTATERARSVVQTLDGGYAVLALTASVNGTFADTEEKGQTDYVMLKLSATGDIEWKGRFGGSSIDDAYSVRQTPTGCYVLVGTTQSWDQDVTDHKGLQDAWVVSFCAPPPTLPVTLTDFKVQYKGNGKAFLEWSTASEHSNDRFEIQRSIDGQNFNTIGSVAGSGTTSHTSTYAYTDPGVDALNADIVYYRLRQVDIDGKSELSQVVMVRPKIKNGADVRVWPNPSEGHFQVQLKNVPSGPIRATIYGANGKVIKTTTFNSVTHDIDLSGQSAGTYFIRLEDNKGWMQIQPVVVK